MKNERIYEAIGNVDDELLSGSQVIPNKTKTNWNKLVPLVACITIIIFSSVNHYNRPYTNAPTLTISEDLGGGMGHEGYLAYDFTELVNENPWEASKELSTLPVYKNTYVFDEYFVVEATDYEKMTELLLDIAERLGMDTSTIVITDSSYHNEDMQKTITKKLEEEGKIVPLDYFKPTNISTEQNGIKIDVENSMTATIEFTKPISLPDEYNFSDYSSYEDKREVAEYLKYQYEDLINMDNATIEIIEGDYNYAGQQKYRISFFNGSEDYEEQIINYNFHRINFYSNENNELYLVRIFQEDLSDKVFDYPIITPEKAKKLLRKGYYITSSNDVMGDVVKVELLYRNGVFDEYFMPYYRFLLEVPYLDRHTGLKKGLKTYDTYYVPAVKLKYYSDSTVWDGRVN